MQYDFSLVINEKMKNDLEELSIFFNNQKLNKIISSILILYENYVESNRIQLKNKSYNYPNIKWTEKLHITINSKLYNFIKQIHKEKNTYSMAVYVRSVISTFINLLWFFNDIDSVIAFLNKLTKENIKLILKNKNFNLVKKCFIRQFPKNKSKYHIYFNELHIPTRIQYLNL